VKERMRALLSVDHEVLPEPQDANLSPYRLRR